MKSFKEQLEIDIKDVFLNPLEFSEPHNINGKTINCVVDAENFKINQKYGETFEIEGNYMDGFTIFAHSKSFDDILLGTGSQIEFDGETYTVLSSRRDKGIFEINVYRYAEGDY